MKKIINITKTENQQLAGLPLRRVFPNRFVHFRDPFLLLDHAGVKNFGEDNEGLSEEPHPHRGIQTVTFLLEGEMTHLDNVGNAGIFRKGDVEWLSAGKGLIHSANVSDKFRKEGGKIELLQLWVNLPARLKLSDPRFRVACQSEIPSQVLDNGNVEVIYVSSTDNSVKSAFGNQIGVDLLFLKFAEKGDFKLKMDQNNAVLFYLVEGELFVNGTEINEHSLVEFDLDAGDINISAISNSRLLLGFGKSLHEPIASGGPFVMNTQEEVQQAYADFRSGKFGEWNPIRINEDDL